MDTFTTYYHPVTIGKLCLDGNLFLAPVAGYSDRAFRYVCREGGAHFCYTEMVSSEALTRGSGKTVELMRRADNEAAYGIQLFGGIPQTMAEAARIVLEQVRPELIDINAGCPVPKIVKTGAGAALTKHPIGLYRVTSAVVRAVQDYCAQNGLEEIPVTVKIRSGWDENTITWKEAAQAAYEAGAQAITLHPRTRAQGYDGKAKWEYLSGLVDLYKGRIPIFGSGDVFSPNSALEMFRQTGCAAVMFARGAMGNPFIFSETRQLIQTGRFENTPAKTRIRAGMKELDYLIEDKGVLAACREMRKRFCAYSKGFQGSSQLRIQIVAAETRQHFVDIFRGVLSDQNGNAD